MKPPPLKHVVAFLVASVAALFARAWLQLTLIADGIAPAVATDLSYLIVPPVLAALLLPVLLADRAFIRRQFRREDVSVAIVLVAIAAGILFRVGWHAHVVAGVAVGIYTFDSMPFNNAAVVAFECPAFHVVLLAIAVRSVLIPLIEEITHRAYVQSYFGRLGPIVAIAISTALFAVFHSLSGWEFVTLAGVVMGTMYWLTGSLWAPVIFHAVTNLLPQLTLRCLDIAWNPHPDVLPLWQPGLVAAAVSAGAFLGLTGLLVYLGRRRGRNGPDARHATAR